jgi:hypothetical protein
MAAMQLEAELRELGEHVGREVGHEQVVRARVGDEEAELLDRRGEVGDPRGPRPGRNVRLHDLVDEKRLGCIGGSLRRDDGAGCEQLDPVRNPCARSRPRQQLPGLPPFPGGRDDDEQSGGLDVELDLERLGSLEDASFGDPSGKVEATHRLTWLLSEFDH